MYLRMAQAAFPVADNLSMTHWKWLTLICTGLLAMAAAGGCGKKGPGSADPDADAKAKVEAIKKLADAMAKEADGADARAALEAFRIYPIDEQKNPQQANEIVEIYRKQIQGKYRGEVAQEVHLEMGPLLKRANATK